MTLTKINYKKAYEILDEYFDCIPEDEQVEVWERLRKVLKQ